VHCRMWGTSKPSLSRDAYLKNDRPTKNWTEKGTGARIREKPQRGALRLMVEKKRDHKAQGTEKKKKEEGELTKEARKVKEKEKRTCGVEKTSKHNYRKVGAGGKSYRVNEDGNNSVQFSITP